MVQILKDMQGPSPMMRLLQGDVGSGKTAVAVLALLAAAGSGWQGALMAPTEVLMLMPLPTCLQCCVCGNHQTHVLTLCALVGSLLALGSKESSWAPLSCLCLSLPACPTQALCFCWQLLAICLSVCVWVSGDVSAWLFAVSCWLWLAGSSDGTN